ncbi:hypothetical protein [Ottowia sp.]|uniref:hypothetical protein n=1 Tax=Ottowia sp. TaxID=1898956 RepID=UPI002C093FD9|nr:hypothetical protein [Ottowia sp.]HOB65760.1 hypothetical protein [Ottowia sp.]HPZ57528.1 hypothetical protein [Ottowia sp.]HQD48969.1 hypothetical protein [Ottowia sp.]
MSAPPSPASAQPSVDVRTLSLAQLQALAQRGSRRARAELEGRMRSTATLAAAPSVRPAPRPPTPGAHPASPRAAGAVPLPGATAAAPFAPRDEELRRLELIARQDEARARAGGPPRLMGMVLIAWGVLLLLGGLIMATRGGGLYYLVCGTGAAGVGWLLLQRRRWAMLAHGVLLLMAVAWAWKTARGSAGLALVQAAPVWIAALWMVLGAVRDPLE